MIATTFSPATDGKAVFDANWHLVVGLLKDLAPYAIGAALVLLAIRQVVVWLSNAGASHISMMPGAASDWSEQDRRLPRTMTRDEYRHFDSERRHYAKERYDY